MCIYLRSGRLLSVSQLFPPRGRYIFQAHRNRWLSCTFPHLSLLSFVWVPPIRTERPPFPNTQMGKGEMRNHRPNKGATRNAAARHGTLRSATERDGALKFGQTALESAIFWRIRPKSPHNFLRRTPPSPTPKWRRWEMRNHRRQKDTAERRGTLRNATER